ncbi:hypothetical protein [Sphingomonas phyllosphaerae]|uniref:hypothetical protein n=1 Tax=Sphingomonas phyllosphaerae TaxID=257003 RepID=UPI0024131DC5|nr:hypothetical protein [Sphingomonas phyllosphaerae]
MICQPPETPRPAKIAATAISGQPVPVPNTPNAAATAATLPIASFREHIQTDCRLASPLRCRQSRAAQTRLAISAATPTIPIVFAPGSMPDAATDAIAQQVERKLADLTALRRELKAVIDSCDGGTVAECRIIEALGPTIDG